MDDEVRSRVEDVWSTVVVTFEVCVIYAVVVADVCVFPASTTAYVDSCLDVEDKDKVFVRSRVTLILIVLVGSGVLTTAVDVKVSLEGVIVTVGAKTVSI